MTPMDADSGLPPWGPDALVRAKVDVADRADHIRDVVIVGAGITGAGVARDAAMRGLDTLLIDSNDLAYGTSSRSSRLIHGGVRYLEQGEIGLVFEALRERARLYALAPHLVRRSTFVFPSFAEDRLQPWKLSLGLSLYDLLGLYRSARHQRLSPPKARELEPLLRADGLRGAVAYEDAITDDARLTLATIQSARANGADVLTYEPVDRLSRSEGLHLVTLRDGTTLKTRAVVVATGPWTGSRLLGTAGDGLLTLSKGVHLVVPASRVPVVAPVVIQVPGQRRILFAIPWGARTYLGTTDSAYEGDPGEAGVTEADEEEVLELVRRVLPGTVQRDHVLSAWSGVRPLVTGKRRGNTVELARTHRIVENDDGVLAIVGGKLTTYRAMAEDVVDRVVGQLHRARASRPLPARRCTTHEIPLIPGVARPHPARESELGRALTYRHGASAFAMLHAIDHNPSLADKLVDDLPFRWVEVQHAIRFEGVRHLDDLLRRRIPIALTDKRLGGGVMSRVASMLVEARGGAQRDIDEEVERYCALTHTETRRRPRA